eukprot:1656149-Rhodomonas_salina.4
MAGVPRGVSNAHARENCCGRLAGRIRLSLLCPSHQGPWPALRIDVRRHLSDYNNATGFSEGGCDWRLGVLQTWSNLISVSIAAPATPKISASLDLTLGGGTVTRLLSKVEDACAN